MKLHNNGLSGKTQEVSTSEADKADQSADSCDMQQMTSARPCRLVLSWLWIISLGTNKKGPSCKECSNYLCDHKLVMGTLL